MSFVIHFLLTQFLGHSTPSFSFAGNKNGGLAVNVLSWAFIFTACFLVFTGPIDYPRFAYLLFFAGLLGIFSTCTGIAMLQKLHIGALAFIFASGIGALAILGYNRPLYLLSNIHCLAFFGEETSCGGYFAYCRLMSLFSTFNALFMFIVVYLDFSEKIPEDNTSSSSPQVNTSSEPAAFNPQAPYHG